MFFRGLTSLKYSSNGIVTVLLLKLTVSFCGKVFSMIGLGAAMSFSPPLIVPI
jgi:hypothetical protein